MNATETKDRLPNGCRDILFYYDLLDLWHHGWFDHKKGIFLSAHDGKEYKIDEITHWMPKPLVNKSVKAIRIDRMLPPDDEDLLYRTDTGHWLHGRYINREGESYFSIFRCKYAYDTSPYYPKRVPLGNVTHWMHEPSVTREKE